jgi:hypothetical protein
MDTDTVTIPVRVPSSLFGPLLPLVALSFFQRRRGRVYFWLFTFVAFQPRPPQHLDLHLDNASALNTIVR